MQKSELLPIGQKAIDFCLPDFEDKLHCLKEKKGQWIILYFYPKDNTPGCTTQACDFNQSLPDFSNANAAIIGVSPDSPQSHKKFIDKHGLSFLLLCDIQHTVLEQYGVWQTKKNYGKEYLGVVRTTYLIDPAGITRERWDKVSVKDHAQKVIARLRELQS